MAFWNDYGKLRGARASTELAWLKGEKELIGKIFKAVEAGNFDEADRLKTYLSTPPTSTLVSDVVPDSKSHHERVLDWWRIAVTGLLVIALFTIVMVVVEQNSTNNAAAPYVSLISGLAGIALGWMFANAVGGASTRGSDKSEPAPSPPTGQVVPAGATPPTETTPAQ
jgi:hypothetical protein